MHMHGCVCICICMHVYVCLRAYAYMCMCVCMCICVDVYARMCMCVYVHMRACIIFVCALHYTVCEVEMSPAFTVTRTLSIILASVSYQLMVETRTFSLCFPCFLETARKKEKL